MTGSSSSVGFKGVTLVTGGGGGLSETDADALYLRIDTANDPLTNVLSSAAITAGAGQTGTITTTGADAWNMGCVIVSGASAIDGVIDGSGNQSLNLGNVIIDAVRDGTITVSALNAQNFGNIGGGGGTITVSGELSRNYGVVDDGDITIAGLRSANYGSVIEGSTLDNQAGADDNVSFLKAYSSSTVTLTGDIGTLIGDVAGTFNYTGTAGFFQGRQPANSVINLGGGGIYLRGVISGTGTIDVSGLGSYVSMYRNAGNPTDPITISGNANFINIFSTNVPFTCSGSAVFVSGRFQTDFSVTGDGNAVLGNWRAFGFVSNSITGKANLVGTHNFSSDPENGGAVVAAGTANILWWTSRFAVFGDNTVTATANAKGSIFVGYTTDQLVTLDARGCGVFGYTTTGAMSALADGAFQFNTGVNNTANSIQLGQTAAAGTGIHFHGGGAPAAPVNGDCWINGAGQFVFQSGGVACVATNAVM